MLAQFVNGSLENNIPVLLAVTGLCMLIGGLSAWTLPGDRINVDDDHPGDDARIISSACECELSQNDENNRVHAMTSEHNFRHDSSQHGLLSHDDNAMNRL